MKMNRGFIIGCLAMLGVMMLLQLSMPHQFSWVETYSKNDSEPYGCMLFDDVMTDGMRNGYGVTEKRLEQLTDGKNNVLMVCRELSLTETDAKALKEMLKNGATVMIAAKGTEEGKTDSIMAYDYGVAFNSFRDLDVDYFKKNINDNEYAPYDTVYFKTPREEYIVYDFMIGCHLDTEYATGVNAIADIQTNCSDNLYARRFYKKNMKRRDKIMQEKDSLKREQMLNEFNDEFEYYYNSNEELRPKTYRHIAIERKVGKGKIIIVSTPLFFTNYGILSKRNTGLTSLLMARLADKPTLRTEAKTRVGNTLTGEEEKTPLDYIFSNRALSDAWRLALFTVFLFMVFKARRRQRVIPVYHEPRNHNIEFVKLIGSLYWQKHDNNDLLAKKFALFAEDVRKWTGTDLFNADDDERSAERIAKMTGMEVEEVKKKLKELRFLMLYELQIEDADLKKAIDTMSEIQGKLS